MSSPASPTILNSSWRLGAVPRTQVVQLLLLSLMVGMVAVLYHLQGVTTEEHLFGRSVFRWLVAFWRTGGPALGSSNDHSHGLLIPLLSGVVVWLRRKELARAVKAPSMLGILVVAAGLFFHWFGSKAQLPRVSLGGLVVLLWGLPFGLYGWQVAKVLLFPCAYLFLAIPLNFLDGLTLPMRVYMTSATQFILTGLGLNIVQSGTALHSVIHLGIPHVLHPDNVKYSLEIADPCSGIRSLMAMVAITAIYAYMTQRTLARKWILFLCAVPLALVGNTMRILTIAIVSEGFGQEVGAGLYHDFSGYIIFMAFTIPLMILTGHALDTNWRELWQHWKNDLLRPTSSS